MKQLLTSTNITRYLVYYNNIYPVVWCDLIFYDIWHAHRKGVLRSHIICKRSRTIFLILFFFGVWNNRVITHNYYYHYYVVKYIVYVSYKPCVVTIAFTSHAKTWWYAMTAMVLLFGGGERQRPWLSKYHFVIDGATDKRRKRYNNKRRRKNQK